jgi:long-chain acyl-CoA synthetase
MKRAALGGMPSCLPAAARSDPGCCGYPAEIERVLCMHPAVALAAVGSLPDEVKGELAKAYVILKPGAEVSRADLVAHCREHLAAYKVPRAVQFVASVPTTSSGKIMRRMLKEVDDGSFDIS